MRSKLRILWRLIHINWVFMRYGLVDIIAEIPAFSILRLLAYANPYHYHYRKQPRGDRLRRTLIHLGPIFVKFGQALSVRADLLPSDIIASLALLQDKVPPFPSSQAKALLIKAYKTDINTIFSEFVDQPLASASVAQVHRARLHDGRDVAVKILRPHIKRLVRRDIELLYAITRLLEWCWHDNRCLRIRKVVAEFEKTLDKELNLQYEAANASQLRRNFADSQQLYVPDVYWQYTRKNVMVMEYIQGVPISDIATLSARGVDLKRLAENSVTVFFTQVIEHRFFHADMHPGNIFVCTDDPKRPYYIVVDFGIMGTLTPTDQRYLAEMFLAFFKRDYYQVAVLHIESGWVAADTRLDEFEAAIRYMLEPMFEKPLKDISFANILLHLFQIAKQFDMPVQPQLVLLQKTLVNVEGLGRQLYPDLDLWSTAKPFLERWVRRQYSPKTVLCSMRKQFPRWSEQLAKLPELMVERFTQDISPPQATPTTAITSKTTKLATGIGIGIIITAGISYLLTQTTVTQHVTNTMLTVGLLITGVTITTVSWLYR